MSEGERRIEVNWVQSLAGAFAAVTSAVLLSTVGVAGTLIGAAVGSIVATVGGAVYSYYIRETKDRVTAARTAAAARVSNAQARLHHANHGRAAGTPGTSQELAHAGRDLEDAQVALTEAESAPARFDWRTALAGLPWKRVALVAGAIFVVAMLVILTFELITGRAVSSYTGGSDSHQRTSIPGFGGRPSAPSPAVVPTSAPSDGSSTPTPSSGSSPSPVDTPTTTWSPSATFTPSPTLPPDVPGGEPTSPASSPASSPSSAPSGSPTP